MLALLFSHLGSSFYSSVRSDPSQPPPLASGRLCFLPDRNTRQSSSVVSGPEGVQQEREVAGATTAGSRSVGRPGLGEGGWILGGR